MPPRVLVQHRGGAEEEMKPPATSCAVVAVIVGEFVIAEELYIWILPKSRRPSRGDRRRRHLKARADMSSTLPTSRPLSKGGNEHHLSQSARAAGRTRASTTIPTAPPLSGVAGIVSAVAAVTAAGVELAHISVPRQSSGMYSIR